MLQWILLALTLALPGGLFAQQFEPIAPLYFTRPFAAPDPLPQVLAIASTTGSNFEFSVTTTTSNGGSWLSASPTGGGCSVTPQGVSIIVNTGVNGASMAEGTYNGQVSFSATGVTTVNVAVTFVIAAPTATFFDNTPGQVSFSMQPGGQPPPQDPLPQNVTIVATTASAFEFTVDYSTATGGAWLKVSPSGGGCCVTPRHSKSA